MRRAGEEQHQCDRRKGKIRTIIRKEKKQCDPVGRQEVGWAQVESGYAKVGNHRGTPMYRFHRRQPMRPPPANALVDPAGNRCAGTLCWPRVATAWPRWCSRLVILDSNVELDDSMSELEDPPLIALNIFKQTGSTSVLPLQSGSTYLYFL